MKTKKLMILLMAALFALGLVSLGFAADIKGTVAKIEGDQLTIVDEAGKQMTVRVPNPQMLQDLKVGDNVVVAQVGNSIKVTKEGK